MGFVTPKACCMGLSTPIGQGMDGSCNTDSAAVLASSKGHRTGLATPMVYWKDPETHCSFAESCHGGGRINVARK